MQTSGFISTLLITLLLGSSASFAQQNENVSELKSYPRYYESTSEANREGKNVMITGIVIGQGPSPVTTQGLAAGVYLGRNTVLFAEATSNSAFRQTGSHTAIDANSIGLHVKQFFGNSLYLNAGVDYRHLAYAYNYSYSGTYSSYNSYENFTGDGFAGSLAIGNQWQWSNFTLGCDWIGIVAPFSNSLSGESNSDSANSSGMDSAMRSDERQYVTNVAVQGLRFYLGVSF